MTDPALDKVTRFAVQRTNPMRTLTERAYEIVDRRCKAVFRSAATATNPVHAEESVATLEYVRARRHKVALRIARLTGAYPTPTRDDAPASETPPMHNDDIKTVFAFWGFPLRPCGLNADWNVEAYHLGPSASPNATDGDLYVLEDESDPDAFLLARRTYDDATDGDGVEIITTGSLSYVLQTARGML